MPTDADKHVKESRLPLVAVEGIYVPAYGFPAEYVTQLGKMEVRPEDIFVVTYPKCGTTWTQYMIWGVLYDPEDIVDVAVLSKSFPFLEKTGPDSAVDLPSPRTFKIHLPFRLAPFHSQGRYVVMARNPFDVCVSFFHFLKEIDVWSLVPEDYNFNEYFEVFLNGRVPFGDFFEFINSWYEHRHEPNVLFLYYEDCKADPASTVKKLASFLGKESLEEDPRVLHRILKLTSFDYMKQNLKFSIPAKSNENDPSGKSLKDVNWIRKGKVGDWRTHFTEDQKNRLLDRLNTSIHDKEFRLKLTPPELL